MHPVLIDLGFFELRTYGVMLALGFVAGIVLMTRLNRADGRSDELALDLAVWIMAGAIIGARLMYVIVLPEAFADNWLEIFAVWHGGLVYYGGLIGSSIATIWFMRRRKAPLWPVADCAAPGVALGQAFGRVGCFFNGCCYGKVSDDHGVVFKALGDHLPHLPTQLWEAAAALLLAVLLWRFKPKRRYPGQVFVLYLWGYGLLRFVIEFWRGDDERGLLFSDFLSPAQWTSIAAITIGTWLHFHLKERYANRASAA